MARDFAIITRQEYDNLSGETELVKLVSDRLDLPDEPKKQNILPAVSDDLMNRIKALQDLYLVDGKPVSIAFILDRCVSALQANINAGLEDDRDDFVGN